MREEIEIPTNCPVCDSKLDMVGYQLFCRNPNCEAKVSKQLLHFAKVMGIKGLGEATIPKLPIDNFIELYSLSEQDFISALGSEKLGTKLYEQVENSKTVPLNKFIAALGIPLVGPAAAAKLAAKVTSFNDITFENCKEAGLGDKASENVMEYMVYSYPSIKDILPFNFVGEVITDEFNRDITYKGVVCITGKLKSLKNKAEAKSLLERNGYQVVDSVTRNTTILVDEENKASAKRKKAEVLNIKVINNLFDIIEE